MANQDVLVKPGMVLLDEVKLSNVNVGNYEPNLARSAIITSEGEAGYSLGAVGSKVDVEFLVPSNTTNATETAYIHRLAIGQRRCNVAYELGGEMISFRADVTAFKVGYSVGDGMNKGSATFSGAKADIAAFLNSFGI